MSINNFDITSANAEAFLMVEEIFPGGIVLQQFGTDQAVGMDSLEVAETRKGVDGRMVAGYVPVIYPVSVTLEAASPSHHDLAIIWQAMVANRRPYICDLIVTVPSIFARYKWSVGVLKSGSPFPSMQKTLQPTVWTFDFENFEVSAY